MIIVHICIYHIIQAIAPGIPTYFYSIKELNPYSPQNEGFLAYLWVVGNQTNPPLVHSISYGDDESTVFDRSVPDAFAYGLRFIISICIKLLFINLFIN